MSYHLTLGGDALRRVAYVRRDLPPGSAACSCGNQLMTDHLLFCRSGHVTAAAAVVAAAATNSNRDTLWTLCHNKASSGGHSGHWVDFPDEVTGFGVWRRPNMVRDVKGSYTLSASIDLQAIPIVLFLSWQRLRSKG